MPYLLPQHVHFCAIGGEGVVLDLKADRYYGLDRTRVCLLRTLLGASEAALADDDSKQVSQEDFESELMEQGLVTADTAIGRQYQPIALPEVRTALVEWNSTQLRSLSWRYCLTFVAAYASTLVRLRKNSIEQIVRRTEVRKRVAAPRSDAFDRARNATLAFGLIRPFFYSCRDRCLFDSIVLTEFLAYEGVYPTWVIGVTCRPFAAHSWVQIGNHVLNGQPGFVRSFTPILAI